MVQSKRPSFIKRCVRSWKNNHGLVLLATGLGAAVGMSAITYFNVIPKIELVDGEAFARQLAASPSSPRVHVDVIIAGPLSQDADSPMHGRILVYPAFGKLESTKQPLISKRFDLSESGIALQTCELPRNASYAIVAFIDENDNSQLDFSAKPAKDEGNSSARPIEPFRFSNRPGIPPADLAFDKAAITPNGQSRTLLHFVFEQTVDTKK